MKIASRRRSRCSTSMKGSECKIFQRPEQIQGLRLQVSKQPSCPKVLFLVETPKDSSHRCKPLFRTGGKCLKQGSALCKRLFLGSHPEARKKNLSHSPEALLGCLKFAPGAAASQQKGCCSLLAVSHDQRSKFSLLVLLCVFDGASLPPSHARTGHIFAPALQ